MTEKQTESAAQKGVSQADISDPRIGLFDSLITETETLIGYFMDGKDVDTTLTGTERRRLFGAGVRNYGFIEKSLDIVEENPDFVPPNFSIEKFAASYHTLEEARQLSWVIQQFLQLVNDYVLVTSDQCYRDALRVYGNLREQSRARVARATPLFESLLIFFRRRRHPEQEPTEKELERDFRRLLHRTAEGKIIIENEMPHLVAGERKVVDDVHKGHAAVKETIEAEGDS
ncbi:MAG: hypothetical protein FWG13_07880 [Leptospirales bacterium]|nr:hypothetical protein [Leptospirales bacterium]